jgi:hypothetical protein
MHALGGLPIPGLPSRLYRRVWWWDLAAHAIGGYAVAAVALVAWAPYASGPALALATVVTALAVGVAWEAYEVVYWDEAAKGPLLYPEDTALDLCAELAVALALVLVHQFVSLA